MKTIILAGGVHNVTVDDEDFERLSQHSWCLLRGGGTHKRLYAQANIKVGDDWRRVLMHRFILGLSDPKVRCDHRDNNGLNNCRLNLRSATSSQNQHNCGSRGGVSRFKGVSWHKRGQKWVAQICINCKQHYIGLFNEEQEAARAYDKRAKELHGEFAKTNF